jgi:uracil-DNA glycosylase
VNVFKELQSDVGAPKPRDGSLVPWAEQGVLLLNAVLTVRQGEANAHEGHGWERFTDAVIQKVSDKPEPVVFILWGSYAQKKKALIDTARHVILEAPHPSPLSAKKGFFGSRPFSRANAALKKAGREPIDWALPA